MFSEFAHVLAIFVDSFCAAKSPPKPGLRLGKDLGAGVPCCTHRGREDGSGTEPHLCSSPNEKECPRVAGVCTTRGLKGFSFRAVSGPRCFESCLAVLFFRPHLQHFKHKLRGFVSTMMSILWMDDILHYFETMGNHGWLALTGKSSFHGFLGGAGFRPSAVRPSL